MPKEKLYTAKEAALAVLAKTQELLAKGEWNKIHRKLESEGYSAKEADKIDGAIKAKKVKKSEMGDKLDKSQGPCWDGYQKVPGKKNYSKGSCKPISKNLKETKNLKKDETDAKLAHEVKEKKIALPKAAKIAPNPKEMFSDLRNEGKKANMGKTEMEKCGEETMVKSDMKEAPSTDKNAPHEMSQDSKDGVQGSPDPSRNQPNENGNPAPGAFPQNQEKYAVEKGARGHLKLAKFMGGMEQKRKNKTTQAVGATAAKTAPQMDKKMSKAEENNEEMAHSDALSMSDKAAYLHKLMHEMTEHKDMPSWVVEKLGQSKAHLQDILDYLYSQNKDKTPE